MHTYIYVYTDVVSNYLVPINIVVTCLVTPSQANCSFIIKSRSCGYIYIHIQYCKHRMTIVIFKAPSKQNTVVVDMNSSIDMSGLCTVAHQLIKHNYFPFYAQYILIVKLSHINTVLWYYVLYTFICNLINITRACSTQIILKQIHQWQR